jgi:DNA-directed RNA polymerase specialized sigma24 family protein
LLCNPSETLGKTGYAIPEEKKNIFLSKSNRQRFFLEGTDIQSRNRKRGTIMLAEQMMQFKKATDQLVEAALSGENSEEKTVQLKEVLAQLKQAQQAVTESLCPKLSPAKRAEQFESARLGDSHAEQQVTLWFELITNDVRREGYLFDGFYETVHKICRARADNIIDRPGFVPTSVEQDTWLDIHEYLETIIKHGDAMGLLFWLMGKTRHNYIDQIRTQKKHKNLASKVYDQGEVATQYEEPFEDIEEDTGKRRIREAILSLPDDERICMQLRTKERFTNEEAAEFLNVVKGADIMKSWEPHQVRYRYESACRKLRVRLQDLANQ